MTTPPEQLKLKTDTSWATKDEFSSILMNDRKNKFFKVTNRSKKVGNWFITVIVTIRS